MSGVSSVGAGGGGSLEGYLGDPPAPPEPGDAFLGARGPLAPGESISDQAAERARLAADPRSGAEGGFLGAPKQRASGERYISDPPLPPEEGDRFLTAQNRPPEPIRPGRADGRRLRPRVPAQRR